MADFAVAVNISAKLARSFNGTFTRAQQQARSTARGIGRAQQSVARGWQRIQTDRSLQGGLATAGMAAGLKRAFDNAVQFEDKVLDLKKVAGDMGKVKFAELDKSLRRLAVSGEVGIGTLDLFGSAAVFAQQGFHKAGPEGLLKWTKLAGDLSIAWGIAGDDVALNVGKTINALGAELPLQKQFELAVQLGDAYNHLGNNMSLSERDLLNYGKRAAGVGKTLGMTGVQTAAFGASLISLGTIPQTAALALQALTIPLLELDQMPKKAQTAIEGLGYTASGLKTAFKEDAEGALFGFLKTLSRVDKITRGGIVTAAFGREYRDDILVLTEGLDKYRQAIDLTRKSEFYLGSASQEAKTRLSGMGAKVQKAKNQLLEMSKTIGEALFPTVEKALPVLDTLSKKFASLAANQPWLADAATLGLAGLAAEKGISFLTGASPAKLLFKTPAGITVMGATVIFAGAYALEKWLRENTEGGPEERRPMSERIGAVLSTEGSPLALRPGERNPHAPELWRDLVKPLPRLLWNDAVKPVLQGIGNFFSPAEAEALGWHPEELARRTAAQAAGETIKRLPRSAGFQFDYDAAGREAVSFGDPEKIIASMRRYVFTNSNVEDAVKTRGPVDLTQRAYPGTLTPEPRPVIATPVAPIIRPTGPRTPAVAPTATTVADSPGIIGTLKNALGAALQFHKTLLAPVLRLISPAEASAAQILRQPVTAPGPTRIEAHTSAAAPPAVQTIGTIATRKASAPRSPSSNRRSFPLNPSSSAPQLLSRRAPHGWREPERLSARQPFYKGLPLCRLWPCRISSLPPSGPPSRCRRSSLGPPSPSPGPP